MSVSVTSYSLIKFKLYFPPKDRTDYTAYEVWRSVSGQDGLYVALTGPTYLGAVAPLERKNTYDVQGKTLELVVDRVHNVAITFSSPYISDIVDDINEAAPSLVHSSFDASGLFIYVQSVGHNSRIDVVESDASVALGFEFSSYFGESPYRQLSSDASFEDLDAESGYYYKTRLRNVSSGATSSFSVPFLNTPQVALSEPDLITGYVYLVDATGLPLPNVLVRMDVAYDSSNPEVLPTQLSARTDSNGYASFRLVRGVFATMMIAGTQLVRKIQVPATGTEFSLTDLSISVDTDEYRVRVPDIKVGERRSM